MNENEMINETINNIIKETKCFNCIHAPICFAQKGGVDLQLASGMGCQYYQAKIADDEIVIKKSEYDTLLKGYTLTYDNAYQWGLKVGEEKTAIEILQKLKDNIMFADFGCGDGYEEVVDMNTDELKELAKSYGIELED